MGRVILIYLFVFIECYFLGWDIWAQCLIGYLIGSTLGYFISLFNLFSCKIDTTGYSQEGNCYFLEKDRYIVEDILNNSRDFIHIHSKDFKRYRVLFVRGNIFGLDKTKSGYFKAKDKLLVVSLDTFDPYRVFAHEYGHYLEDALGVKRVSKLKKLYRNRKELETSNMYALLSVSEYFAEIFTCIHCGYSNSSLVDGFKVIEEEVLFWDKLNKKINYGMLYF